MEGLFFEQFQVPGQQCVSGQDQVVILQVASVLMTIGAIQGQYLEVRGEVLGFIQPVGNQTGGHDGQRGSVEASGLFFHQQVSKGLQRFAQPHVISQHAADFQLAQRLHPAQAFQLIRAQCGVKAIGQADRRVLDVDQAFGEMAQTVATLPGKRQVF